MKYIILCGGMGKRNNNYSLPKPLNFINGKHLIEYIIEKIPSNELYIIYNTYLDTFNFKEIVINKFKNKKIIFSCVDYYTRGPVETALVGVKELNINNDENILFIDNDNIHKFPLTNKNYEHNFIYYSIDYTKTNYSFIKISNNNIINIEEKKKISDNYCCGLYGFINISTFIKLAENLLTINLKTNNEFYFSLLYKQIIQNNERVIPILIEKTKHIGTYNEITDDIMEFKKLRICFDLDNTLVTYPTIPNDYSTVRPIQKNIDLLNRLKKQGHEIIIYTARRMQTHNSNIGKVVKDIAMTTFKTLEEFNIIYDEIIFGKPIADIYIDDRAINPYVNNISYFGIFYNDDEFIMNKIDNNKYNKITKVNNNIIKTGLTKYSKGELYYYQNIPKGLSKYYTKLLNYKIIEDKIELYLEYIDGIPLYYLYKNTLLATKHIDDLFDILNNLHTFDYPITINNNMVRANYFYKLKDRFNNVDYNFTDAEYIYNDILLNLEKNYKSETVPIIHGDFWFSNILLTYNDEYKLIDMRGSVYNELSLNGDKYYDYGKLYQSILGYDLILNNNTINYEYIATIKNYFIEKCKSINLDIEYLRWVTKALIFGTFVFLDSTKNKDKLWDLIKSI
jgi:capsule biosynthesis phosphatase